MINALPEWAIFLLTKKSAPAGEEDRWIVPDFSEAGMYSSIVVLSDPEME